MPDFMVLRNAAAVRTASPFESLGPAAAARNVPEPRVEVHNVAESEAVDMARDPQVAAVAKPMPTSLIEPLELARTAATSAWGIAAVKADTSNFTGNGVVVAVLDTGIDKSHPAFAGVTIVEEDFSGSEQRNPRRPEKLSRWRSRLPRMIWNRGEGIPCNKGCIGWTTIR
jgi:Subtilase family